MKFNVYFVVKGKQYSKSFNKLSDAENAKRYVRSRGATNVEIRVQIENERNNNENI